MRFKLLFMKNIFVLVALVVASLSVTAQDKKVQLTESSIVKDSTGRQYPYSVWSLLLKSLDYDLKLADPGDKNAGFIIFPLSEEEKTKRLVSGPQPEPSKFFKTGKPFGALKTKDINGNKIDFKELKGKVIVLNYWFINCPPCRTEIPHLNKLVAEYAADSNVVFIAIALDKKDEIEEFLKLTAFDYTIIDDGAGIAREYRITGYPTNVVINKEGNVAFHTSGYGAGTTYWIKKSIEELK